MRRNLQLVIVSGVSTCYDQTSGAMCPMVRVSNFGRRWSCRIFNEDGSYLEESDTEPAASLLLRHADCLQAENAATVEEMKRRQNSAD